MVEDIPLTIDLTDRAVGIAIRRGRGDGVALLVLLAGTTVDDGAAIGPRAKGIVAIGIGQRVVGCWHAKLTVLGETAIDKDVLILDFADAGGLEEAEHALLVATADHILHHLGARLYGSHRGGVELSGIRAFKAPVAIHATIVVNEYGRIKLQYAIHLIRVLGIPVAHLEGTVRAVTLGYQSVAETRLVVGEQIVGLLAIGVSYQRHVWRKQHVGGTR